MCFFFFFLCLFGFGCLWSSVVTQRDAATAVCSGWFGGSLALTSTAEPWGTFTTDLASHFQCCSGRPLRSVSAVPSSFHITSLRLTHLSLCSPPPPPTLAPISPNLPLSLNGGCEDGRQKKGNRREKKTGQTFPISSLLLLLLCRYQRLARKAKWIHERSGG